MPRRDGTGPMERGSMTGRGVGVCTGSNAAKYGAGFGLGLGCRRGYGRNTNVDQITPETQIELLQEQNDVLQRRLEAIETCIPGKYNDEFLK